MFAFKNSRNFKRFYDAYKDDDRVAIYSVNVPIKRDTGKLAEQMIRTRDYTFPIYYAYEDIGEQLSVKAYPTVLLIQNDTIVARGGIENVANILKEKLQ